MKMSEILDEAYTYDKNFLMNYFEQADKAFGEAYNAIHDVEGMLKSRDGADGATRADAKDGYTETTNLYGKAKGSLFAIRKLYDDVQKEILSLRKTFPELIAQYEKNREHKNKIYGDK